MVGRAGFLVRLLAAAAVLVGCAAPPADASAAWVAVWEHYSLPAADALVHRDDRGDAGFLDGGSPTQWFDLVVFHRTATPAGMP